MAFLNTLFSSFFKSTEQKKAEFEHTRILVDDQAIQAALDAHESWKNRLTASIDGLSNEVFDPNVVCFDNRCVLGQWIYTSGKVKYAHHPKFSALISHHKMFHFAASNALALHFRGKTKEAKDMLAGQLAQYSDAVLADLNHFRS